MTAMFALADQGSAHPLGARVLAGGTGFSVFSRNARSVELLLYDGVDDVEPARVITLDPNVNRTYHYWHTFVPGVGAGQIHAYRAHGPSLGLLGSRFEAEPGGSAIQRSHESAGRSPLRRSPRFVAERP